MVKKNRIYLLFVCIGLLLFTQVLLPYLHNHTESVYAAGITEDNGDHCLVCSLDIVPADFILPVLFAWIAAVFAFAARAASRTAPVYLSVLQQNGRAPPLF